MDVARALCNEFKEKKWAASQVQAVHQGRQAREEMEKTHASATYVQAGYRKNKARKHFEDKRNAANKVRIHVPVVSFHL